METLDEVERLFTEGVREAGERARTAGVEVGVGRDGNIVYAVGAEETKNATELSEKDLRILLESTQNGLLDDGTYLHSNTVVYDKKKTNGKYQVGSGRIVTVAHDTPFVEDIVQQTADSVNSKSSISQ